MEIKDFNELLHTRDIPVIHVFYRLSQLIWKIVSKKALAMNNKREYVYNIAYSVNICNYLTLYKG